MRYAILAGIVVVAATVLGFQFLGDEEATPVAEQPQEQSVPQEQPQVTEQKQSTEPREEDSEVAKLAEQYGMTEDEIRERMKLEEHQRAAEARFHEAVDMDGLTPEALDPGVRDLFQTLKLKPAFDLREGEQGSIDGMVVDRMTPRNPLAQAGFKVGDKLTRINGVALTDPAEIAHLFTRVKGNMEVCAEQGGSEVCKSIKLAN